MTDRRLFSPNELQEDFFGMQWRRAALAVIKSVPTKHRDAIWQALHIGWSQGYSFAQVENGDAVYPDDVEEDNPYQQS